MNVVNFGHSTKDVPIPSNKIHSTMMISSMEKYNVTQRWAVLNHLKPFKTSGKDKHGFKSNNNPPVVPELTAFEADFFQLVKNVKYRKYTNKHQEKLKAEVVTIKNENNLIVAADKTSNHYIVNPSDHEKMVKKEVTKDYKKANKSTVKKVDKAHQKIVKKLEINDRVFETTKREAYVTLKDHKENFHNDPKCRLINPMKPDIGRVSHNVLKKIIEVVKKKSHLRQLKNVYSCIEWFEDLPNKKHLKFIIFDIATFYPSISSKLLKDAISWARNYTEISAEDEDIFFQARKTFLMKDGEFWQKKSDPEFDVPMGGYDSAEVCDIVGLYILSLLEKLGVKAEFGLFKDDGLAVSNATPRETEQIKKKICKVFESLGLNITIEANKKVVQFLDVELNLNDGTYKPYIKPNDVPLYVNKESSHPPSILKNIPLSINRRLSALSSSEEIFESIKPIYQQALNSAGYNFELKFQKEPKKMKKRCRKRKILWFNPPWSSAVKTNIGAQFLKLVDKHFPKGHPLHKLLNRNTVKVSYRTTPNIKKIISSHNTKILKNIEADNIVKKCNCTKMECPLNGECLSTTSLIYKATVTSIEAEPKSETYVGLASNDFKERWRNHDTSFNNRKFSSSSELSKHIWKLKEKGTDYILEFQTIDRAAKFNPQSWICNLCTLEKYYIVFKPEIASLNVHNEINKPCIHKDKMLLDKT